MEIHFHGAPATESVLQTLRNLPTVDANANLAYDGREAADDESGCTSATCEPVPGQDSEGNYQVEENATKITATGAGGLIGDANIGCGFDGFAGDSLECPDKKFIWLTGGLNAEVVGPAMHPDTGETAVKVNIFPTMVYTSNLEVFAQIAGTEAPNPSGPQIMRLRYDQSGSDSKPITGWIRKTDQGPVLETELNLYLDAPYLEPTLSLPHNLHSYEASLELSGPVDFLADGRMRIQQKNEGAVPINVSIGGGSATIDLQIPSRGAFLNFMPTPIKE